MDPTKLRFRAFPGIGTVALLLVAGSIAVPSPAAARGEAGASLTLSGRVLSEAGEPLAGAEVAIPELGRRVLAGDDGSFRLSLPRPGRYTVVARRLGYATRTENVEVEASRVLTVRLEESALALPGLSVSTSRRPVPTESPLPTTTLDGEELRRARAASLARTLEDVPGVRNFSTGAQNGKPVIRGLSGTRVLVLDNGANLENQNWGDEHGPNADPFLADRIEVVRGPATVLYGSDALAGVVNVLPPDLPDALGSKGFVRAGLTATAASNNGEVGGALRVEGAQGALGYLGTLAGRRAGDLETPLGALENSGFDQIAGSAAIGARGGWGDASIRYTNFTADYELVEGDRAEPAPSGDAEAPFLALRDHRVQGVARSWIGEGQFETKAQWERNRLREFETPEEAEVDLVLNTFTVDLLYHHEELGRWNGTVGISGLLQDNDTRGEEPLVPDARTRSLGVFAFEEVRLGERWKASLGARADLRGLEVDSNAELDVAEGTESWSAVTGSAGLLFSPLAGLSLAANLGRGWRAPNAFELFSNGVHEGTTRFEIGDPSIDSESSLNADLSARWSVPGFRGVVSAFRNDIQDFIFIEPTGEIDSASGFRKFRHRSSDALLWGGEARVEVHPVHPLEISAQFDWVRGELSASGDPLPLIPPARLDLGIEAHREFREPWAETAYLSLEAEIVTRQERLSEFDAATGAYTLYHAGAGIGIRLPGRRIDLDLEVRNLTDKAYRDFLSRYKEFALDPGRNFVVKVTTGI